jgi:sulfatase maturation enzyme AslB (radical SAM superfamily)
LDNQQPQECQSCHDEERLQGRSLRTDSQKDYQNQIFTDTQIDFIDFRSVNICNFKCRSCNPVFSHGIAQEARNNPTLEKFFWDMPSTKTATVTDENINWIMQNLSGLKRLMLTGGEPTVIPGIKDLVEIIAKDHPDIMIMITSNASFEDDFWFEITKKLPNLHWTVSIDAVGSRAGIVRHGSVWSKIEANVAWLAQHANSLDINSVVSNLTVFGLKPLLEFGRRMQYLSQRPTGRHGDLGCRHQFFVTQRPYYLCADNWPDSIQSRAMTYLKKCLNLDLDQEQHSMLTGLIGQIESSVFDSELWEQTQIYNFELDSIRNENHQQLYQEQW